MPAIMETDHSQSRAFDQIHAGSMVQMPSETGTFITAKKVKESHGKQSQLDI
jgi:hypothetical protein